MSNTYSACPSISIPSWLTGAVWRGGPEWSDVSADSGQSGVSRLLLEGTEDGPSIRVYVEDEAEHGTDRFTIVTRTNDSDPDSDDTTHDWAKEKEAKGIVYSHLFDHLQRIVEDVEAIASAP